MDPLDDPIWHALSGPHARLGLARGNARRYRPEIAPHAALADVSPKAWSDLAALSSGLPVALFTPEPVDIPDGWELLLVRPLEQMLCERVAPPRRSMQPIELGPRDVADMLDLVELTDPGPFGPETIACGRYVGWRSPDGALAALAGERMSLPSHVEISAVCTAPEHRGAGLAGALVDELARAALARGQTPLLHVWAENVAAVSLYEALGFRRRRTLQLTVLQYGT